MGLFNFFKGTFLDLFKAENNGVINGQIAAEERIDLKLTERRRKLQIIRNRVGGMKRSGVTMAFVAIGCAVLLFCLGFIFDGEDFKDFSYVLLFAAIGFLLVALTSSTRALDIEIQDIDNELDLLPIEEAKREQRAEKLFKVHQFELKKYYDLTLAQSRWIFYVGVLCIVAGFVIIGFTGYGLYDVIIDRGKEIKKGLLVGVTGLLSAVLVEFIGKVFMDMYKKTVESLGEFHKRLVTTHHLHFANFLVAKIASETVREKAFADIASNLAGVNIVRGDAPEVTPGEG